MQVKVASPIIGGEEISAVAEVLRSGRYVSGKRVEEFEKFFANYIGVKHAVAVNSGTAALHAALMAADVGLGDEVIVPPVTFFSTITSVIHQGAVPIFADINMDNYCLSPADISKRITRRTKAIIVVHYFGHAAEMDAINTIADNHGLVVIEDCAQAHGTMHHGRKVGSIGDMGAFSFFATKHITTGEGGIITTSNADWAEKMKLFRSHGLKGRNNHVMLGYNYRMNEIAAAMGLEQLKKLDAFNEARIRVSNTLAERLKDVLWLTLPKVPGHVRHTYFWMHVLIDEEKLGFSTQELIKRLKNKGIETRYRYTVPLYHQPLFTTNVPEILRLSAATNLPDYGNLNLPNSEKMAGRVIGLPNRPDMTQAEIDYVVDTIKTIHDD